MTLASTKVTRVFNGQTFHIWDEGAYEHLVSDSTSRAIRKIRCDWIDRLALAEAILGSVSNIGGINVYINGDPYPDRPFFVARDVKTRGDGVLSNGPNGMVAYERAELTVTYTPWWANENGVGSERITFGTMPLLLSTTNPVFKWGSDSSDMAPEQAPALFLSTMEFVESRLLNLIPKSLIASLQNCRNNASFLGMPADKVMFLGANSFQNFTVVGAQVIRMDYTFKYISCGWNKIYRPPNGAWGGGFDTFKFKGDNSDLFPAADLGQLLA